MAAAKNENKKKRDWNDGVSFRDVTSKDKKGMIKLVSPKKKKSAK